MNRQARLKYLARRQELMAQGKCPECTGIFAGGDSDCEACRGTLHFPARNGLLGEFHDDDGDSVRVYKVFPDGALIHIYGPRGGVVTFNIPRYMLIRLARASELQAAVSQSAAQSGAAPDQDQ